MKYKGELIALDSDRDMYPTINPDILSNNQK